jgi:hypothetical protein
MSNNTPILVTGAAGNVGSVGRGVVKLLRERDLPVRALVHRLDERSQVLIPSVDCLATSYYRYMYLRIIRHS